MAPRPWAASRPQTHLARSFRFPERLCEMWTPDDLETRITRAHDHGSVWQVENRKLRGCIFQDGV